MKKLISVLILAFTLTLLSGCERKYEELPLTKTETSAKAADGISIASYEKALFTIDTEYLRSAGFPDDVIEDVKDNPCAFDIVYDGESFYYFTEESPMMAPGLAKYKIYKVNDGENVCIYESEDDTVKDVYAGTVFDGKLFWDENVYESDRMKNRILCLDLSSGNAREFYSDTDSFNSNFYFCGRYLYWQTSENKLTRYDLKDEKREDNAIAELSENGFVIPDKTAERAIYYSFSDNYAVVVSREEGNSYQTFCISDKKNRRLYTASEKDFGQLCGCGIIGERIYILSGGEENKLYIFDLEEGLMYDMQADLGELMPSFPLRTENDGMYFYGDRIYVINPNFTA